MDTPPIVPHTTKQIQSANHEPIELLGLVTFTERDGDMPMFLAETLERE